MKPIYKPKGKAKEYGDYAINIYTGCPHRCYYCFAPSVLHRERGLFHANVIPRDGIVEAVKKQLEAEKITDKLIHLCFTCDPYPVRIWQQQIEDTAEFKAEWREFMDKLRVEEMEVSAYAPLDPAAIEGMCYSDDPKVTATGARTTPGRTIASDPDVIPMGARVYIPGVGVRVAEDRGGTIEGYEIDLCMSSRSDALAWGRQKRVVMWLEVENGKCE